MASAWSVSSSSSSYRTPEAYIDNLRTINAMRLLRTQPNYSIAAIAQESGFNHVHLAASNYGRYRHDTCGLQNPLHTGYVATLSNYFARYIIIVNTSDTAIIEPTMIITGRMLL